MSKKELTPKQRKAEIIKNDKKADDFMKSDKKLKESYYEIAKNLFKAFDIKMNFDSVNAFVIGMQHKDLEENQHAVLMTTLMSKRHQLRKKK